MLAWLLFVVVEGSEFRAAHRRFRPKSSLGSAPHPFHKDGRGIHFFPMTHHYGAEITDRDKSIFRRNRHAREASSEPPSSSAGLSQHARITETASDDDGVGWYHTSLGPRSGAFTVNLTFTAADGTASAWPVILDTGSANLAVATAACSTCNDSATDLAFSSPESGASEVTVVYGASEATSTWFKASGATSSSVGFEAGQRGAGHSCAASTDSLAAITQTSTGAKAFFNGEPPFYGLWGLAYPGLAAPFTLDSDASTTIAAVPFLTSLWNVGELASLGFALQFCGNSEGADSPDTQRGGFVTLGGYFTSQLMAGQDGVVWLPNIDHTNIASADNDDNPMDWQYYQVRFASISVDGDALSFDSAALAGTKNGANVDSGTTFLTLPTEVLGTTSTAGTLRYELYQGYSGSASSLGYQLLADWLDGKLTVNPAICTFYNNHLPPVSITLGGATSDSTATNDNTADNQYDDNIWELPLNNSRLLYMDSNGFCAFAAQAGSSTILGNVAMGGLTVIFDQSAHLIGFAEGDNCDASLRNGNFSRNTLHLVPGTDDDSQPSAAASPVGWLVVFALFICVAIGLALGCQNMRCKNSKLPCFSCCKPDPPQQDIGGKTAHATKSRAPMSSSHSSARMGVDDAPVIAFHRSDTFNFDTDAQPTSSPSLGSSNKPPPKPPRRSSGLSTTTTTSQQPAREEDMSSEVELADIYKTGYGL